MTPSERRARVLALKQQRENRNLYQQYLTQKEEYDRRVEQERLNALYEENKVKNQNFFVRAGHTIGDIAANVITGAVKGLEGIYDLGAGIVGAVGGIFDKGFQDDVKKHISYDWTMETFGNDWQEALKYSYTKNGGIVESVASGIGQMLPSVAVTIATDGAGAPAAVSQMASLATLGASAAGNATEEAFNDGAGYYAGLGYGLASGAVEIATEKMFGGATKGLFGKGMLDEVGKSIADTGIKRIAKNALEEGVEEIVSELANPLLRSMYKGGEALQDYGTGEYWAGVAKAGIVGSLTSLAYTGTVGYGLSKAGVGYVGKEADINESLAEIETQKKKAENLFANEKLTEQNESRISSNIVGNYQNIERTLKKASESKRASLIKKFSLEKAFNPDGSIKGDFATQIGLTSNEAQVAQEGQQGSNEGLASQFKKEYYSPSLRGSEAMIQADLAAMTERLRTDEKNFATQQGREAQEIAEVKPFTGEMSDTAKKNYTSLKKGLNALNNTSGGKIRLVVVDSHDSINGSIVNDSTFYISESQLESGAWAETLVHEYTHFAEGSKEYGKLLGFLQSDDILVEGAEGKSIPLWQKAQEAVIRNYGFDQKRLESIVERVGKNESLSPEDMVYYNAYLSELGAHESEYLLGNEAFIDKIIRKDKSLAAKIIDKIHNLKSMFEKTNDTRTRKEQRLINKAEKLWLNSVEKAGLKYSGGKIYRRREVDAKAQNEYNGEVAEVSLSRKVAKYIPYTKIGVENVRSIRSEINNLYSGIDNGVADGIALVREKTIYILDTGKDNGEVRFGFRKAITISDDERRSRYAQHINEEAANDGFGNREIYARLGVELGNDSGSNVGRELQQNTQNSQRESKNIKDRPLKNDRNRRVQEVKFSRTSQDLINSQMSMETCRDMLQRTFKLVNPNQYEESIRWRTADEWLADIGVEEAALYIDNEYEITRRFFSEKKTPGVYNGDVYTEQILEAYLNKTLTGEKIIEKPTRLSLSESNGYIDKRFYSPKAISEAKSKLEVASQKITNQNRSEVQQARADILLFAHQKGAAELLGITQAELNKKLLSWAHYPAKAKEISTKLNEGVALENKWVGLENSSYMVSAMVDEESMRRLVKDIVGRSTELERSYITNTMLALDTHIDYSQLTFEFGAGNEQLGRSSVRGEYRDSERKIYVRGGAYQNTVAHEIGHAIDHQWAREIFGENSTYALSDSYDRVLDKLSPDKAQFVKNFRIFIESIMDSGDISSEYTQRANETFARFVARFVEWTKSVATGRYNHIESSFYSDKFTASQYLEFVRLLQEKAKIDSERLVESEKQKGKNIKFSRKNDNVYHFINKLAKIEISWNEESDTYHLYCENAKGYLEYEGTLTEDEIESRFGDELGLDLEQKAWEKDGGVATLDRSWIEYYADEIKPQEKYDDDYLTEAKEQYGTTDNVLLAGYINTDGSMLDFSGGYESRFIDHSEIDTIFDEESGVDAMYAYMRMGNIRLMPEAPSLEFNSGVEPTSQQYDTIKKAIDILIEKNGKVFNNGKASYLQTFADPMTVARYMDKYENGFYSEMLAELRAGGIKASVLEMNIRQPLEEFLSKHKKYGRGVSQRTIKYKGIELPALDAFLLYMTMNREQALGGLAEAGFTFNNGKETIGVDGFAKGEELTLAELRERAKAEQDELYKQFTEEDREYISIAEKIFNEDCREAKVETDLLRQGYSNVAGYYVPIDRANSAKTVDSSNFFDEGNRVSNASFNKDTVQGAKGELFIEGLDEVLDRYIHGISLYAGLATVIDQYDILYNLNMSEDANKPITMRTESKNTWAKGNDYFKKLISDLQGISPTRGGGSKLFGFFRGHYATYQLGLNPKVWFTQLSSFFASGSVLDYSSILKGLSINAKDVDEYCQLAAVRNNDNSAAMAQGVMDKVDKVGSALMKPIGMVDRFVVKKLFGACQVQVEKESGLKVGTEENKKKAGELLEKVIVETQQNSMATERSAAMRSGSELMKTLTMFTADSMKVFGRVVDSLGEVSVLKAKIKETTDSKVKAELEEKLKAAKKKSVKSVAALATTAIFMALIAQAFRWLYNKDDEDENIPANMAVDAIGNLMGGLPLIKDLYAKLTEGYDLNNYSYSALNDLFDAFSGTISTVTSLAKGEEVKPLRTVKELSYAVGQILGLPTRNVYNIIYGLTKRISPSTAYGWDSNLYNKNYATDLQKAINNDDDEMLATIVGLMLNEKVGGIDNSFAREEMDRLVKGGYQVIPKSIGSTISYEGEEVEITSKQRERFKKVYGEANKALASLVNNKSYASTSDEVKAKAVRFIYDIYYNLAIEDLLGVELETKNILFAKAIDISSLAIIVAMARSIEADTDKKGNIVSGSRKKKVQTYINSLGLKAAQKYMIMGYLGYSNKNGQQQVKSYIQRLSLTKSEKEKLYEYSGYAA